MKFDKLGWKKQKQNIIQALTVSNVKVRKCSQIVQ